MGGTKRLTSLAVLTQPGGAAAASDRARPHNKLSTPTHDAHVRLADNDDDDLYLDLSLPSDVDSAPATRISSRALDDPDVEDHSAEEMDGDLEGLVKPRRPQTGQGGTRQRSARRSQSSRPDKTDPTAGVEAPAKTKKPTEAEKKKARVSQCLRSVLRNQYLVPNRRRNTRKKMRSPPNYRARVRKSAARAATGPIEATPRSRPLPQQDDPSGLEFRDVSPMSTSTPGPSSIPQPAPPSPPLWKYALFAFEPRDKDNGSPGPSTSLGPRQREHVALSDEEIEVHTPIVPGATIEGDEVVPASTKKPRAPRSHVSLTISRAFFTLDKWVQETVLVKIVPSLIELYGASENPWSLDGQSGVEFGTKLNSLLTKLHPNRAPHDVKAGDKIWRFTRQQVYNWRSNFGKLAIKIVKGEVKHRADQHGKPFAVTWVANALAKGGEATYSTPDTQYPNAARGALQTTYHIRLLTYHYEVADGSIVKTGYPIGALSLAVVAIRRAFHACTTGVYVPIKTEFSDNEVGQQTQLARQGAVKGLEKTPHRFDSLVSVARSQVPSFLQAQALQVQTANDDADAFAAVDPPSSPVFEH
ncbi:hypothetical protein LXA43DRAFT_1102651 [Ganoderma leucocontextum]|nr:hypothetical protein LXA43DRAFT_1102651 [Ganoderma leucocontextum]